MLDFRPAGVCALLWLSLLHTAPARSQNLHLIDSAPNGFAIYRSGVPGASDLREWCSLGISEVMVLSGDADTVEHVLSPAHCPSLRVAHHERQKVEKPVDSAFLKRFDAWVERSKREGRKILFRCQCGCHRTGRLAAYYEMKYMGRTAEQVAVNLERFGKNMDHYPFLSAQIAALRDYAEGKICRYTEEDEKRSYCVGP